MNYKFCLHCPLLTNRLWSSALKQEQQANPTNVIFPLLQVNCANKPTRAPRTRAPTAAAALPLSRTTSAPALPSSQARPANRTSTSATPPRRHAGTAACASTRSGATRASARSSTRASTARAATCPAARRRVTMEERASRRETPATSALACPVKNPPPGSFCDSHWGLRVARQMLVRQRREEGRVFLLTCALTCTFSAPVVDNVCELVTAGRHQGLSQGNGQRTTSFFRIAEVLQRACGVKSVHRLTVLTRNYTRHYVCLF